MWSNEEVFRSDRTRIFIASTGVADVAQVDEHTLLGMCLPSHLPSFRSLAGLAKRH
jgi:hypothetical protein